MLSQIHSSATIATPNEIASPFARAQQNAEDRALLQLGQALKQSRYRFITISPASHARVNQRPRSQWANNFRDVFGWSRPFREDVIPPAIFSLMRAANVVESVDAGWRSTVRFSTLPSSEENCRGQNSGEHEELFVHSAYPTDAHDAVFFGPDTYRFVRAIQGALDKRLPVQRALDLGCGSGAGAIAIANSYPDADVIGSDINEFALRLARVNALLARKPDMQFEHSEFLDEIDGEFDLIIANPPFMNDALQRSYRHGGGQYGEALSLRVVKESLPRLRAGGTLLLYTGSAIVDGEDIFLKQLKTELRSSNARWNYEEVDPDIFGEELVAEHYRDVDRIAAVLLTCRS